MSAASHSSDIRVYLNLHVSLKKHAVVWAQGSTGKTRKLLRLKCGVGITRLPAKRRNGPEDQDDLSQAPRGAGVERGGWGFGGWTPATGWEPHKKPDSRRNAVHFFPPSSRVESPLLSTLLPGYDYELAETRDCPMCDVTSWHGIWNSG